MIAMWRRAWSILVVCLTLSCLTDADDYNVDMENTGVCTMTEIVTVKQYDVYNIYAQPPQDHAGTRDRCTVKFRGDGGRKFKIYVRDLAFTECQVFIKVYDGDMFLNYARYQWGCQNSPGISAATYNNEVAISLEKPDASITGYRFYLRLATEDGPDITGAGPNNVGGDPDTLSGGMIAGIAVGSLLFVIVIVSVSIYCVHAYRNKQDQKLAYARSMSTLLPSGTSTRAGTSVHSSMHDSAHDSVHSSKHNPHNTSYSYPAFRSTISGKTGQCNSIDTKSYDSDQVDVAPPKPIKSVKHEFDSMRRGIQKENYRREREKEELRQHENARKQAQRSDRQGRAESNRTFGRSRSRDRQPILNDVNIKRSLREEKEKGRSLGDRHSNQGSTRSRSRNNARSHSPGRSSHHETRSDYDYYSDRNEDRRERGRGRSKSESRDTRSRKHKQYYTESDTHSDYDDKRTRSRGRHSSRDRKRENYDDRDNYSDYDDRSRRNNRHDSRDRYENSEHRSRRDSSGHRSTNQRSRSQSAGRRQR